MVMIGTPDSEHVERDNGPMKVNRRFRKPCLKPERRRCAFATIGIRWLLKNVVDRLLTKSGMKKAAA
jgi:hypothetical protein